MNLRILVGLLFAVLSLAAANAAEPGPSGASVPQWLEPSEGSPNIDTTDFHIQVLPPNLSEGVEHVATDFELWDVEANEPVWLSLNNTGARYHVHNGDGSFAGRLEHQNEQMPGKLEYERDYRLRARFHTSGAAETTTPWSEWRSFRTREEFIYELTPEEWEPRDGYQVELVASNISLPVNIEPAPDLYDHLPDGKRPLLYVTQLYGQVGVVLEDGTHEFYATDLLNYNPIATIPGAGEAGVTGIAVHEPTGDLFVSYVYTETGEDLWGRVERFYTDDSGTGYTGRETVIEGVPAAVSHQIQELSFGPDGMLYLNTGEAATYDQTKDPNILAGRVLRMHPDGRMPDDNPYPGTYSYVTGLRNPFGAAWRPGTGELYVTNNGDESYDGIFQITGGEQFGYCCDAKAGTWYSWHDTVAPVGITFDDAGFSDLGGDPEPVADNGVFFVALSGSTYLEGASPNSKRIAEFHIGADGEPQWVGDLVTYTGTDSTVDRGFGAPIGVTMIDGDLYFTDIYGRIGFNAVGGTNGRIYRVTEGNGTLDEPDVGFDASLAIAPWYPKGLDIVWLCKVEGGSGDYRYDFDFGDGSGLDDTDRSDVYHVYPDNGTYTASCTVTDQATGETSTATETFTLGSGADTTDPDDGSGDGDTGGDGATGNLTCARSIAELPVSCSEGSVTADDLSGGCRTVTCSSSSASTRVKACTKDDGFEMYHQSGAGIEVCFGDDCLDPDVSGFGTGDLCYESSDGDDDTGDDTTNGSDGTGDGAVCPTFETAEASCSSGSVTTDSLSGGCRTIVCSSSNNEVGVLACGKDDGFEMYHQSGSGIEICLGDTCLDPAESGYAKQACTDDGSPDDGSTDGGGDGGTGDDGTNDTNDGSIGLDATLRIADWYPQGTHVIWTCSASGAVGDVHYTYDFGDGSGVLDTDRSDIYHVYADNGTYTASCTVTDQANGETATDSVMLVLGDAGDGGTGDDTSDGGDGSDGTDSDASMCRSVFDASASCSSGSVTTDALTGGCRSIVCTSGSSEVGVLACGKDDGFEMYHQGGSGIEVCLDDTCLDPAESGFAKQTCTDDGGTGVGGTGGDEAGSGDTSSNVTLSMADWYPQGTSVVLVCEANTTRYTYDFGDGSGQETTRSDVYHTYESSGTYTAMCTTDVGSDTLEVNVG